MQQLSSLKGTGLPTRTTTQRSLRSRRCAWGSSRTVRPCRHRWRLGGCLDAPWRRFDKGEEGLRRRHRQALPPTSARPQLQAAILPPCAALRRSGAVTVRAEEDGKKGGFFGEQTRQTRSAGGAPAGAALHCCRGGDLAPTAALRLGRDCRLACGAASSGWLDRCSLLCINACLHVRHPRTRAAAPAAHAAFGKKAGSGTTKIAQSVKAPARKQEEVEERGNGLPLVGTIFKSRSGTEKRAGTQARRGGRGGKDASTGALGGGSGGDGGVLG